MKVLYPYSLKRVALFEANDTNHGENQTYNVQRHMYLVSKIGELRRKQQAIAIRQDQQLALVSDCIEIEKRGLLNQLFDLEREEV
jgi:hypothetical protein